MKKYSKYRDSGVEWLGEIPEHWDEMKLKYLANVVLGKMLTPNDKGGYFLKPYLRAKNLNWLFVDSNDIKEMWFSENELDTYRLKTNDLLVSEGGDVGRTCIWQDEIPECYIQNSVNRVRFRSGTPKYFLYQFYTYGFIGAFNSIVSRVSIAHLTKEKLNEVRFILPPITEQNRIAEFLDLKTSQIDSLIEKKRKMIELLKEERAAIINQAVTKGINPDAEMKDSGIEWLGEVPKHWQIKRYKHIWNVVDCKHLTAEFVEDGIPLASIREVQDWEVNLATAKMTTRDYYEKLIEGNRKPEDGDIIFSRNATVGETAIVTARHPLFAMGQDVCILKPKVKISSSYFLFQLKSRPLSNQLEPLLVGSTFKRINVENINNFLCVVPPIQEQLLIDEYLKSKTTSISMALQRTEKEIELIEEYRTALINETVTGKIDVREKVVA